MNIKIARVRLVEYLSSLASLIELAKNKNPKLTLDAGNLKTRFPVFCQNSAKNSSNSPHFCLLVNTGNLHVIPGIWGLTN